MPDGSVPQPPMRALFVHGMWRSPASAWPMLHRLRAEGWTTSSFAYSVVGQATAPIVRRLADRIVAASGHDGGCVLIGHSLGGVLLRMALASMPAATPMPRRLFLLGSPVQASRYAQIMGGHLPFRALTGECGRLLASVDRMMAIGAPPIPATAIVGTRSLPFGPFGGGVPNDGIVSVAEAHADWIEDTIELPLLHTVLPARSRVAEVVLQWMARPDPLRADDLSAPTGPLTPLPK